MLLVVDEACQTALRDVKADIKTAPVLVSQEEDQLPQMIGDDRGGGGSMLLQQEESTVAFEAGRNTVAEQQYHTTESKMHGVGQS